MLSDFSNQHISINFLDPSTSMAGLITGVYGSTDYRVRCTLWEYLVNTSSTSLPWTVIGDFNSILITQEKLSTHPHSSISVREFYDMIMAAGLKDLGFSRNRFTLANNRQGQAYVAARLDRALSNTAWLDIYEDPLVKHLPRLASDHSPLLLSHRSSFVQKNFPFKFEEMWLQDDTFSKVVETSWATTCSGTPSSF